MRKNEENKVFWADGERRVGKEEKRKWGMEDGEEDGEERTGKDKKMGQRKEKKGEDGRKQDKEEMG